MKKYTCVHCKKESTEGGYRYPTSTGWWMFCGECGHKRVWLKEEYQELIKRENWRKCKEQEVQRGNIRLAKETKN